MVLIFNPDSAFFRVEEYPMNWIKTTILMAAITALFMSVGHLLGGQQGMMIALLFALAMNFFLTGFLTSWCCACIGRRKWMTASRRSSIELCMIWQCAPGCRCRAYI